MTVLGCIADDFTGATDLAGLLARSGARVSLRMGVPSAPPSDTAPFEVIALKCRTSPKQDAINECRAALRWLKEAGATRFFWKYCSTFDSTADGNIGPVAEALMQDLGTARTIYCPAFPENGRSVYMGNLFVGQQPLSESPMKDHPLTPMRDSNLVRLLDPQVTGETGLIDRRVVAEGAQAVRAALAGHTAAHVIVDAVADDDLRIIAEACAGLPLLTGGSALAMPLPALYRADGTWDGSGADTTPPTIPSGAVVLSGSCSAMTRAQVASYAADAPSFQLNPETLAVNGPNEALEWLAAQPAEATPLLYASAEPEQVAAAQNSLGRDRAGAVVEEALARLAIAARDQGRCRFVVAGGETSGAVTKALGVAALQIGVEIAPGVPWTYGESAGTAVALALKSGNFGAETFFSDALARLQPQ